MLPHPCDGREAAASGHDCNVCNESARLCQRAHDGLVEALAHRRLGALDVRPGAASRPTVALATRKQRPTTSATSRSSGESPTQMHSSGAYPRARMCAATAAAFEHTAGIRWKAERSVPTGPLSTSRSPPCPSASSSCVRLARCRACPGTGGTPRGRGARARAARGSPAVPVALEEEVGSARVGDLAVNGEPVARLELAGEERELPVDHEARPQLEDVGALADQPGVLHHLGAPPARVDHHLRPGPVAGLERPGGQQREVPLGGPEQRRAPAEQGAVEVGVDAADGHGQAAPRAGCAAIGGRWTTRTLRGSDPAPPARGAGSRCAREPPLGSQPGDHGLKHGRRHRRELRQLAVSVLPRAEVDLGHPLEPDPGPDVDQHADLDAVAAVEWQLRAGARGRRRSRPASGWANTASSG